MAAISFSPLLRFGLMAFGDVTLLRALLGAAFHIAIPAFSLYLIVRFLRACEPDATATRGDDSARVRLLQIEENIKALRAETEHLGEARS